MGLMAVALLGRRRDGETALDLLDTICGVHQGCDAEFEAENPDQPGQVHPDYNDYTDPLGPLGTLIREAFCPDFPETCAAHPQDPDAPDAYWVSWFDGPYKEFRNRYGFC